MRRPKSERWDVEVFKNIRARPGLPNPIDAEEVEPLPERLTK